MSGWHSLSGYLFYKPGGSFQKLKAKKKLWCVFEEKKCQLLCYKNEQESLKGSPTDIMNIKDSAIILDTERQNQFTIMCNGKEYIFCAENHESMMIWLLGLQAKQMHYSCLCCTVNESEHPTEENSYDKDKLYNRGIIQTVKCSNPNMNHARDSNSSVHLISSEKHVEKKSLIRMRSLPPLFKDSLKDSSTKAKNLTADFELQNQTKAISNHKNNEAIEKSSFISSSTFSKSSEVVNNCEQTAENNHNPTRSAKQNKRNKRNTITGETIREITSVLAETKSCCNKKENVSDENSVENKHVARETELEEELMETKCTLAKVLNTLTTYQETIARKDLIILQLDQHIEELEMSSQPGLKNENASKKVKEIQEHIRVLQNKNRFLNKEVQRLATFRQQDQLKYADQYDEIKILESEIYSCKREFCHLIQSCIKFPRSENIDESQFISTNQTYYKEKVCKLLEEARQTNPSLPVYERLISKQVHVDSYGFKHVHSTSDMAIHYTCQQLSLHYSKQLENYDCNQIQWKIFTKNLNTPTEWWKNKKKKKELKLLGRKGIPDQFRGKLWSYFIKLKLENMMSDKGLHYFSNLCNIQIDCQSAAKYRRQIFVDLLRTMPNNVKFSSAESKGVMDLQDILLAYCVHNPCIGYCQGMNFFAAMCLLFMNAHDTFWALVAITEFYFPQHYFDNNLIGAQADQFILKDLVKSMLPNLAEHLERTDIELSTITLTWFMAIFFDSVPFQTLLRIWDCFIIEGPKILFRFSVAILKIHEAELLKQTDTISLMKHVKSCAKLTNDVEELVKVAFEELNPFPKWQTIRAKQVYYQSMIQEHYKWQKINENSFLFSREIDEEKMNHLKPITEQQLSIQTAEVYIEGFAWFCYGKQDYSVVFEINCFENVMYELPIKFDTKVLCCKAVNPNMVLFGTLSSMLYAYQPESRVQLWEVRLLAAALSLNYISKEKTTTIFVGLSNGNIAILEDASISPNSLADVLYIPLNQAPITSLLIWEDTLWCASANRVFILSALTLDSISAFQLSDNPYEIVLSMKPCEHGVWISLKGSSVTEIWDPDLLTCKMKYDIRNGWIPIPKEDDEKLNEQRVTCFLPHDNMLWIGVGDGNLSIYEIFSPPATMKDLVSADDYKKNLMENNELFLENDIPCILASCNDDTLSNETIMEDKQNNNKETLWQLNQENTELCSNKQKPISDFNNKASELFHEGMSRTTAYNSKVNDHSLIEKLEISSKNILPDVIDNVTNRQSAEGIDLLDSTICHVIPEQNPSSNNFSHLNETVIKQNKQAILELQPSLSEQQTESGEIYLNNLDESLKEIKACPLEDSPSELITDLKTAELSKINEQHYSQNLSHTNSPQHFLNTNKNNNGISLKSEETMYDKTEICLLNGNKSKELPKQFTIKPEFCDQNINGIQDTKKQHYNSEASLYNLNNEQCQERESNINSVSPRVLNNKQEVSPRIWSKVQKKSSENILPSTKKLEKLMKTKCENGNEETHFKENKENGKSQSRNAIIERQNSFSNQMNQDISSESNGNKLMYINQQPKEIAPNSSNLSKYDQLKEGNYFSNRIIDNENLIKQIPSADVLMTQKMESDHISVKFIPSMTNKIHFVNEKEPSKIDQSKATLHDYHESKYRLEFSEYDVKQTKEILDCRKLSFSSNISDLSSTCATELASNSFEACSLSTIDGEDFKFYNRKLSSFNTPNSTSSPSIIDISDSLYLNLVARLKISEKPVVCLLEANINEEPLILSFSGFHGDEEPVLRWRREPDEKIWTNEPVQEICPITKVPKPSGYLRNCLQSNSQKKFISNFEKHDDTFIDESKIFSGK
ncbi:uncharacterized protein LOC106873452 [Octopus bimaculoides]|nr:uncharacterized protein LOC106873452 [Octopus bimaculoides]|eukprot:XP_014776296.1 PREDICTED: uncharacterized protein LOC106873452 [Octopus bimaculoides]